MITPTRRTPPTDSERAEAERDVLDAARKVWLLKPEGDKELDQAFAWLEQITDLQSVFKAGVQSGMRAARAHQTDNTSAVPDPGRCPSWCERPAGHGWTERNVLEFGDHGRSHERRVGGVEIYQSETYPAIVDTAARHLLPSDQPEVSVEWGKLSIEVVEWDAENLGGVLTLVNDLISASNIAFLPLVSSMLPWTDKPIPGAGNR